MQTPTDPLVSLLRRGLLWIAGLTTLGLLVELAVERHWTQPVQLVAWVALGILALAIALLAWARTRASVRRAQVLAAVVILSGGLGIAEHVYANYDAGPLDRHYSSTWDGLGEATRWWLALSKTVGPSPPLAPGALAQAGLCVLLAAYRHPSLGSGPRGAQMDDAETESADSDEAPEPRRRLLAGTRPPLG